MPIANSLAKIAVAPLPRVISPKAHAVVDYITIGCFLVGAGWFWSRNKRAAVASLVCGGAELAVALLTDYPGGVKKVISYRTHGDIDMGLGAMTATMPEFLAFDDEAERKFFLVQGVVMTVAGKLSKYPAREEAGKGRRFRAA
jgi:hypothetical protein